MFRKQILIFLKMIDDKINEIDAQLKELPDGNLICCHNRRGYSWYRITPNNKEYIPKAQKDLATQLTLKKRLLLQRQDLETEKQSIELYLNHYLPNLKLDQFHAHPEYQNLISNISDPIEQKLLQWQNSPYQKNDQHPESLIYKSNSGNTFRSKSESIIALCLEKYQIPYRYECALELDDIVVYPDFTIFHPCTGETLYWEHFGLMDKPDYIKNAYSKLSLYTSNGIIPSIHLITTFETQKNPFDISRAERIIQHFLLSQ